MRQDSDIIIVGGGMVGMLQALLLARAGMHLTIIEKGDPDAQIAPEYDGRTMAIAEGSRRVLEAAGVWEALAPDAGPILDIRITDQDSLLFLHYDHHDVGDRPMGHIVEVRHIRKALLEATREQENIRWITGVSVDAFEQTASHAVVTLSDGQSLKAQLALAADGRLSYTRKLAGIDAIQWRYPQTAIVCTVEHEKPHHGIAHERFLPAGPFAILPMTGHRSSIVWTEREDLAKVIMDLPDKDFLEELKRRFGDFMGSLKVIGPRFSYPLVLMHANHYTGPRFALLGDAAHGIHPIAGQGVNLGIRDVAVLEEILVERFRLGLDLGSADALAHYERWRRFDSFTMIAATDLLNRLFSNNIAPIRLARDLGLAAVHHLPPLKRFFMRHAMGLVGDLPRLMREAN